MFLRTVLLTDEFKGIFISDEMKRNRTSFFLLYLAGLGKGESN
jgi:hypothetical protein